MTGLGRVAQVEEFLSMANWSVLKNPSCRFEPCIRHTFIGNTHFILYWLCLCCDSNGLRSKLHRNFGRMYLAAGRNEDALKSLAQDAYYSSLDVGPDSPTTAGAYYHMGAAFLAQVP